MRPVSTNDPAGTTIEEPLAMRSNGHNESESLAGLVTEVVGGLGHLVALHVRLARAELTSDLGAMGRAAGVSVVMAVPLVVGYALLMVGAGFWLGRWLGWGAAGGFVLVGAANVLVGALGAWRGIKKAESVKWGDKTGDEVRRSVEVLTANQLPAGRDSHVS